MRPGLAPALVRVTNSLEDVQRATEIAFEKQREGYSSEALAMAVDEVLRNQPLSRAIVLYVQSVAGEAEHAEDAAEKPISWATSFAVLIPVFLFPALVIALFRFVDPLSTFWGTFLIVLLQAILLKMMKGSIRLAVLSTLDALNEASFPTRLHPMKKATAGVGVLRLRRLRGLINDTANRLAAGEDLNVVQEDLAQVNLTAGASKLLVRLAKIVAVCRDYVPPYESRWVAWGMALAFIVTCVWVLEQKTLAEGYRNYAVCVTGWLAGDLAARPRRRPQLPAS